MQFNYKALDSTGATKTGAIDAPAIEIAISSLQRRGLVLSSIEPVEEKFSFRNKIPFFKRVRTREIVILSRQIATLFQAQVPTLQIFRLLADESENITLRDVLSSVADDIQGGSPISKALIRHPEVFSDFYANMVRAGEEAGKLDETFGYLADYLERTHEVTSRITSALIYPVFVILTFIIVMAVMFTFVIPKISVILNESGVELPIYTKIVLGISSFFVNYFAFIVFVVIFGGIFLFRFARTPQGKTSLDKFRLQLPYVGVLYRKLYLSRIADNIQTMLESGIPLVHAVEITSAVVDNEIYRKILLDSAEAVRGGSPFSASLSQNEEIPRIMTQMIRVGEETGESVLILKTLAKFYQREVMNAVDALVSLIEPAMVVILGVGVGVLLASVLVPIYNLASAIG